MMPVYASAIGLWAPGFPNAEAWVRRQADSAAMTPAAALLAPGIKRRASLLTRAAAEAFAQAVQGSGAGQAPTVFASAYGEIATTLEMLDQMATDPEGLPSPTRFHNSVHNTAAGYASIATANRSFSTSLAAGLRTVAMGMLESTALLAERGGDVVLVVLDELPPTPFEPPAPFPPLAVAFRLSADPSPKCRARLCNLRKATTVLDLAGAHPLAPFSAHPCACALHLVDALANRNAGPVALSLCGDADWTIDLEPL